LTELLQDTVDVEDLLDIPMAENMYWDATTGRMKVDAAACEV
jgi:hypothetical protein